MSLLFGTTKHSQNTHPLCTQSKQKCFNMSQSDSYRHTVPAPDLIDRLRQEAEYSRSVEGDYYGEQFAADASLLDGAADEILRLRDIIKTYAKICQKDQHDTAL